MKATLLLLTAAALSSAAAATKDTSNWPAFRGPNSSGVSVAAKPPVKIDPKENAVWKSDVPWSPSSPTVWGDHIVLTTFNEGKLETRCYDRREGKLLWSRVAPAEKLEEFHSTEGSPAAGSPALDGTRVVSYFGSCGLLCYDTKGKELWRHVLPPVVTSGAFGSGSSPLIVGDLVIVNRDQAQNSSLLAVRLHDGKKAWETPRTDSPTSYGTPILSTQNGVEEVLIGGSLFLKGYNPKTGAERWVVRGLPSFTCTTPVLGNG